MDVSSGTYRNIPPVSAYADLNGRTGRILWVHLEVEI